MSLGLRFRAAGVALSLGGLMAGICHLFNCDSPTNSAYLGQHHPLDAPVHLVLFAGALLVLLGWFGNYAVQRSAPGNIGFFSFVCLFLGILWADLMHSILEFSVFPVLDEIAPYAVPRLAEATYGSLPVCILLNAGKILLLAGVPAAGIAVYRSRTPRRWLAVPFALTAALQVLAMFPQGGEMIQNLALTGLYLSMAILGMVLLLPPRNRAVSPALDSPDSDPISF